MKYEVDSYILEYIKETGQYYISFRDGLGNGQQIEISREIFEEYMKSKKAYIKIKNETTRYIEHSEIYSNNLNKRATKREKTVEEIVENKIIREEILKTVNSLPEKQKMRIKMYYEDNKTLEEIAKIEKCSFQAIDYNIKIRNKKFKK